MYHKEEEIFSVGFYLDDQSSDLVVEVYDWRLVFGGVCIFGECVLVGVVIVDGALVVPGGNDVDVVVRGHPVPRYYFLPLKQMQCRLGVSVLYCF